jgi:hypothetical protein
MANIAVSYICCYIPFELLPEVLKPVSFEFICFTFASLKMPLGFKPMRGRFRIGQWLRLQK